MTKGKIVLFSTLALAFALGSTLAGGISSPFIDRSNLEILWENPYEYWLVSWIIPSSGPSHAQDDFRLETFAWVKGFECWFLYGKNHPLPPLPFELTMRYDDLGSPGDTFWTAYVTDVTDTDTGDDLFGFDIWHILLLLDEEDYIYIDVRSWLWLEIYWTGYSGAWVCEDGGNAHYNGERLSLSCFFTVLGTPSGAGVEESSWGEIKALEW
ncbi:hypothetical protein KAU45_02360 [bacterium]|nr:hypothetical protein [bacterium]